MNVQKKLKNNGGFIKAIFAVVGALVFVKYLYDIDIIGYLTQGRFKELLDQFYSLGAKGWDKYNHIIEKAWNYILDFIKNIIDKIK